MCQKYLILIRQKLFLDLFKNGLVTETPLILKRQLFIKMLRTIWSFFCVPCFDSAPSSLPTSMLQPMNHYIFTIIYFHKATEGSLLTAKKKDSRRRTRAAWVSFTCPISISKTRCYQAYDQPKCLATKLSIFSQEKKNLSSAVLVYNGYSFSFSRSLPRQEQPRPKLFPFSGSKPREPGLNRVKGSVCLKEHGRKKFQQLAKPKKHRLLSNLIFLLVNYLWITSREFAF